MLPRNSIKVTPTHRIIWEPLAGSQTLALTCPAHVILYHGTRGPGKGLPLGEPVYTPTGPRPIGGLRVGDYVSCPDGSVSPIIGVYPQGLRQTYEIEFFDGSIARCDDQHIWTLHVGGKFPSGEYKNYTMQEVLRMFNVGCYNLNVPTLDKIDIGKSNGLKIDPYTLGLFLGDGCSAQRGSYCTIDDELAEHVVKNGFRETLKDKRNSLRNFSCNTWFTEAYYELGLKNVRSHTKFVPIAYLHASHEDRLAVLQGLMDTDGTIDKRGYITFTSVSLQLAKDVQYLARSLGARATLTEKYPTINGVAYGKSYNVYIQPAGKFVPFRLSRKVERMTPYMHKNLTNKIVAIRETGKQETVCIKIAHPSGLFVTRDFVVTHNTDAHLMRFRMRVGQGYGRHWRGVIFDREYKNLDDLISKSQRWFPEFDDGARFLSSKADYKWVWPTGEELLFRRIRKASDYWGYHGQEFPFIGWNELTKFPDSGLFDSMMSCNRSSYIAEPGLPELPLEVFATCNPYGVGHNWVKKKFISPAKAGTFQKHTFKVFNPRTQSNIDITRLTVHLFGSYRENKYLDPLYVANLESITDPNKRRAWLFGDWDVVAGGMFDDVWNKSHHVLEPFAIPRNWTITRSFDWGESKPFSVGWWAHSDGSDVVLSNGQVMSTLKGDLFRIAEWYGADPSESNKGLRMLARDISKGIIQRELEMRIYGRVNDGPADNAIWNVTDGNSIAVAMAAQVRLDGKRYPGVTWTRSDKSPGSRKAGWKRIRQALSDAMPQHRVLKDGSIMNVPREHPGMFVFSNCKDFIELVPVLPRDEKDPDDVDTDAEDHIGDEARYQLLDTALGVRSGVTEGS